MSVVDAAVDAGITRFLDMGSGPAWADAVHEFVSRRTDQGGVIYVDNEPVVKVHMELMLDEVVGLFGWVPAISKDLLMPEAIVEDEVAQGR